MSPTRRSAALALVAAVLLLAAFLPHTAQAFSPRRFNAESEHAAGDSELKTPVDDDNPKDCHSDHASTVWMCISTVLVLGMSPALALFEAGMLRSKNTVSLISQIFGGVITLSVMWVCFGYTLTFGKSQGGFIGNMNHAFFIDVSYSDCSVQAIDIPEALFAIFQMMFAVITPLLMTGAFAERVKFKFYIAFIVLWEIIVYYPLAHWIWNVDGWLGKWGVVDFAGGIVIHTSAGIGSLVAALYLGRRKHFYEFMGEFPPSNLPLAATGAALLWIGWFGFNGGSALASGPVAVSAIVSTQVGCSCGAFMWLLLSWWKEKPQSVALMNGALAGLAGITPASGYINTPATILMGCIFGIASFFSVVLMKHHLHVDDALDVSSVHGLTGILGSIAIGFFAQKRIDPLGPNGLFYGHAWQLCYQVVGVLFTLAYAGIWTYVLLKFLDVVFRGIRASEEDEEVGIDWSEHHEIAYHKLHVLDDAQQAEAAEQPHFLHTSRSQLGLDTPHTGLLTGASSGVHHPSDAVPLNSVAYTDSAIYLTGPSQSPESASRRPARTASPLPTSHQYKRASAH